ncbi:hypothetical protein WJX79_000313 [Trebouxia sp. C0005]
MWCRIPHSLLAVGLLCTAAHASAGIKISSVDREVAISHQLVVVTESYVFHNDGKSGVQSLLLCSPAEYAAAQAHQEVTVGDDEDAPLLRVEQVEDSNQPANITCMRAHLESPAKAGSSIDIELYTVHIGLMTPFPAQASQSDPQRVLLKGSHYVASPYPISKQTTKLRLSSTSMISLKELAPTKRQGRVVTFGPYSDTAPYAFSPFSVHFENNNPFIRVTKLTRELEVSHWGNVYVDEKYYIRNDGAKHKGPWSRLDVQKNPAGFGRFALSALTAKLPPQAHTFYFRDEIGNISTSNIRFGPSNVQAEIRPRFPLYGGWKTEFTFGYSLPLSAIVSKVKSGRQLEALFSSPFDNVVVDDLVVKVVLPEGATSISAKVPFPVNQSREVKHTYLDTTGRPVVVLHKTNLVPDHNVEFTVNYSFFSLLMLREPFLLVSVFALLFAGVIGYVRCDFVLSRDNKWHTDRQKEKAVALVQKFTGIIAERRNALTFLDYALSSGSDSASRAKAEVDATIKRTNEQLKAAEQQHEQIGSSSRNAALASLREKELAMQAIAMQLFNKRLQLMKDNNSLEEADSKLASQIRTLDESKREVSRLTDALLQKT